MDTVLGLLILLSAAFTLIVTILGVWLIRKPHVMGVWRLLLAIWVSLFTLPVYMLASGLRLNLLVIFSAYLLGIMLGIVSGIAAKMSRRGNKVIGNYSATGLMLWGASLCLSIFFSLLPSVLLAALGLLPVCLTSGIQAGNHTTLFIRRLLI